MATFMFQIPKSFSVLLSISLTFFLLLLNKVNSTESVSFSYNKFIPNQQDLILQGDALVTSTGKLQLNKLEEDGKPVYDSLGRALYAAPIRIWDSTTGNVASFVTLFSFIINAPDNNKTADGLAFFLGPVDTQPKSTGGLLGLFDNTNYNKSNQIVAVEFDTYTNDYDPKGTHIGIDVNSIQSTKTASWDLANGKVANVIISYEASTKSLTASLVHPSLETSYIVTAVVDFKDVLPEWVRVGFSANSGKSADYMETHDVLSWSFHSKLSEGNCDALENNAHPSSYMLHDSV